MGGEVTLINGMGFGYGDGCELDRLGNAVADTENALQAARRQLREAQRNVLQCEADLQAAHDEFYKTAHRVAEIRYWASLLEVRRAAYALWAELVRTVKQLPPEEAEKFDGLFESTDTALFQSWSVPSALLDDLCQEHKRLQGTDGGPMLEQMEDEWGRFFFLEPIIGADKLR